MAIANYKPSKVAQKEALQWAQILMGVSSDKKVFNLAMVLLCFASATLVLPFILPSSLRNSAVVWSSGGLAFVLAILGIYKYQKVRSLAAKLSLLFDRGLRHFAETYPSGVINKSQVLTILKANEIKRIFELCGVLYVPKLKSLENVVLLKQYIKEDDPEMDLRFAIIVRSNPWKITIDDIAEILFPKYMAERQPFFAAVQKPDDLKPLLLPKEVFQPRLKKVWEIHPTKEFFYV